MDHIKKRVFCERRKCQNINKHFAWNKRDFLNPLLSLSFLNEVTFNYCYAARNFYIPLYMLWKLAINPVSKCYLHKHANHLIKLIHGSVVFNFITKIDFMLKSKEFEGAGSGSKIQFNKFRVLAGLT